MRTELHGAEQVAFAIADNRTSELAAWSEQLGPILSELALDDIDPTALGFTEDEFRGLMRGHFATDGVPRPARRTPGAGCAPRSAPSEYEQLNLKPKRTIHMHFATEEDAEAFAKHIGQDITPKTKYLWFPGVERENHRDHLWQSESDEPTPAADES